MRHLLYVEDDDLEIVKWIQRQQKDTEKRLAEGWAVLIYLQNQLVNVACDDPGSAIGAQVALPYLQVGCASLDEQCCGRHESGLACGSRWPRRMPHPPGAECTAELPHRRPWRPEALWCAALLVPEGTARACTLATLSLRQTCSPVSEQDVSAAE